MRAVFKIIIIILFVAVAWSAQAAEFKLCMTFEEEVNQCQKADQLCVEKFVERLSGCEAMLENSGDEIELALVGIHRALLNSRISKLTGCPDYFKEKAQGYCVYENEFLNRLIQQFPESHLLPEATWLSAQRVYKSYECEGFADCTIENRLYKSRWYLERFPNSFFSELAVSLILEENNKIITLGADSFSSKQSGGLFEEIQKLREIAPKLAPELSEKLLPGLRLLEQRVEQKINKSDMIAAFVAEINSGELTKQPSDYLSNSDDEMLRAILEQIQYKSPQPLDGWISALLTLVKTNPEKQAVTTLCKLADKNYDEAQNWLVNFLMHRNVHIYPVRCHSTLAPRMRVVFEDTDRTKNERAKAWNMWVKLGNRKFTEKEILWMTGLLDSEEIGYLPANTLARILDFDSIVIGVEAVISRLESGKAAWAGFILNKFSGRIDIGSYRTRIAAVIPALLEHPDFNNQQLVGLKLLDIVIGDAENLYSYEERIIIKNSIEKLAKEYPQVKSKIEKISTRL